MSSIARRVRAILALLMIAFVVPVAAESATAARPAGAVPLGDGESLWVGRRDGTDWVFDTRIPANFVPFVTATGPQYAHVATLPQTTTQVIDGQSYTFITTGLTWDLDLIDRGAVAFTKDGWMQDMSWWTNQDVNDPEWPAFSELLKARAVVNGTWKGVELIMLVAPSDPAPTLRRPVPPLQLTQEAMRGLAQTTAPGGQFFPNVNLPADLEGFRAQMLAYSNIGRADPSYRANSHKATTVLDLSQNEVTTLGGQERVFRQSDTPPFFADQQLNPLLNQMAQFQAECNASVNVMSHDCPAQWTNPADGQVVNMADLGARAAFFGPQSVVEGAATGAPGDSPMQWMTGDTHFRPFFNVDGIYWELGYGAAQAQSGEWMFVVVAIRDADGTTPPPPGIVMPGAIPAPEAPAETAAPEAPAPVETAAPEAPAPVETAAPEVPAPVETAAPEAPAPAPGAPDVAGLAASGAWFALQVTVSDGNLLCLEANGPEGQFGGAAFATGCEPASGRKWRAVDVGNGLFELRSESFEDRCLEGNELGGQAMEGTSFMDLCSGASGQQWRFTDAGNGQFHLASAWREANGECLTADVLDGNLPAGGRAHHEPCVDATTQRWSVVPWDVPAAPEAAPAPEAPAAPAPAGFAGQRVQIQHVVPGTAWGDLLVCIDDYGPSWESWGNGVWPGDPRAWAYQCDGIPAVWLATDTGDGHVQLVSGFSKEGEPGRCLEWDQAGGTAVIGVAFVNACSDAASQRWLFTPNDDGTYAFRPQFDDANRCVTYQHEVFETTEGGSMTTHNAGSLELADCSAGPVETQRWSVVPVG